VKKTIVLSVASMCLVGFLVRAWGQTEQTSQPVVNKVGLIDMARVFKEYTKFSALREGMRGEIEKSDEKAKAMALQIGKIREEMKQFKNGSTEYIDRENNLTKLTTEFETFRKQVQRDFLRKEAEIYKTVYLEVVDVVQKYADYYSYTLVLRFNGNKLDTDDPQKLIQAMNQQVVYHRAEDDITPSVIEYLNRKYQQAKAPADSAVK